MTENLQNPDEATEATEPGRRVWLDITIGSTVVLWAAALGAASVTPSFVSHAVAMALLTVAGVVTMLCAFVFVGRCVQRKNAERHRQVLQELNRLQVRDELMLRYVDATSRMLESVARNLPQAVNQRKWKAYTEAAEDLVGGTTGTVHLLRKPPPPRLEESTGDLGPHINGHRN